MTLPRIPLFLASLTAAFALAAPAPGMNKAELVDAIAKDAGLSKADSKRALEGFIAATEGALKKGDKISLVGFGTFSASKRAARTGRNPQTGKEIKIAAKNVVKFKAGADLSKKVNIAPPGGGGDDGTGETLKFAGEIPPDFAEFTELFFARTAPDLGAEFLAALAAQGAALGEIDAFDSASIDGADGIACDLIAALEEQGVRRPTTVPFLDSLAVVINSTLATGEPVVIAGFGAFGTEELPDRRILATFEPEFDLGLSIILAIHEQIFDRIGHELARVARTSRRVSFEVILATRSRRLSHTDFDGAQHYRDLVSSAEELVLLGDEFGDKPLTSQLAQLRDLVNEAEGDFVKFYEKGNSAAGTRVRKAMQELKNLAQDIRKEVQEIKNNG